MLLGLPCERLNEVRATVAALRSLDGADDIYTPVAMAVRGPKARALAAEVADTVTFASFPDDQRAFTMGLAADFLAVRDDVELACHVGVVGDTPAPFMTGPGTDPAAMRALDSLAILPGDPAAATEEIVRRREEGGFSYFIIGANAVDALAPVVASLAGN